MGCSSHFSLRPSQFAPRFCVSAISRVRKPAEDACEGAEVRCSRSRGDDTVGAELPLGEDDP
ncbi:hypothetical protein BKA56DRAFT_602895, partial [Ilyonectria sp. MPI-CAGE-AT-0026]